MNHKKLYLIPVPNKITLFDIDIMIRTDDKATQELHDSKYYGCFQGGADGREILLDNTQNDKEFSDTFIHETLESINGIVLDSRLPHNTLTIVGHAIHQILEQLGIRFVKKPKITASRD